MKRTADSRLPIRDCWPRVVALLAACAATSINAESDSMCERLANTVATLTAMGCRMPGYPGSKEAEEFAFETFEELGLAEVRYQPFRIGVPVEQGQATLTVDSVTYRIRCLWPNVVRTCTTPPEGLMGRLIYAGRGEYTDYDGKAIAGAIVLLDLDSGSNYLHAFQLGAKAAIFIAPEKASRQEAEAKFASLPLDAPRYWIDREDGQRVRDRLASRVSPPLATIRARMDWQQATARNVVAMIQGNDPKLRKQYIVLSAPMDSASVVPTLAPGAQSACGLAALVELARYFKQHPPRRTVLFLATNAHFLGLGGIGAFVRGYDRVKSKAKLPKDLDPKGELSREEKTFYNRYFKSYETKKKRANCLFIGLDLTTGNDQLGLFARGGYEDNRDIYRERAYSSLSHSFANRARAAATAEGRRVDEAYSDTVNPPKGQSADTYFPELPAFESEVASFTLPAVTFATCNDSRQWADTPFDDTSRADFRRLASQVSLLLRFLPDSLNDPKLPTDILETHRVYGPLFGRVVEFDPTRSFVPDKPVANAVLVARPNLGGWGHFMVGFPKPLYGVHCEVYSVGDRRGKFDLSPFLWPLQARVDGFAVNPSTGAITYAYDQGTEGEKKFAFRGLNMPDQAGAPLSYVVFRCVAAGMVELTDPRYLISLQSLNLIDADTESPPNAFGVATPLVKRYDRSYIEPSAVLFVRPGTRIKVTMSLGLIGNRLVLLRGSARIPEGEGFRIKSPVLFSNLDQQIAQDLFWLDEGRLSLLGQYGIKSERLDDLHKRSLELLRQTKKEAKSRRWSMSVLLARQAWALESGIYPDITATANDVVKGVLFYLFLVIPFAYFLERLLFGFPDIRHQIIGVSVIFTLVLVALGLVHPAFRITLTPFIIFLAFVILTLAVLVIGLTLLKFNQELQRWRGGMRGVHKVDVNRLGALTAAFNLGIANMRRRPQRTALTCVMIVLLTFTVLSFTSLPTYLRFNEFELPWRAPYNGVFYRHLDWSALEESEEQRFEAELGGDFLIAPRAWRISSSQEDALVTEVADSQGTRQTQADVVIGLSANEAEVTDVRRCLVEGRWFLPAEKDACILSETMAEILGASASRPSTVRLFGMELRVVGVFDPVKLDKKRGLANEPITAVNFQVLRPVVLPVDEASGAVQAALEEYFFFPSRSALLLPYELLRENGGDLRAVAAVPRPSLAAQLAESNETLASHLRQLLRRWAVILFVGDKGRALLFSSIGATTVSGLREVLIPILIAALIVLNTMLGSVYERTREITVYSSVGLSPLHTASLFVAEACVYATIGSISGYLLGQVVAKGMTAFHVLSGLTLNYSSGAAVMTIAMVMFVIVLSTLYPARQAMRLAVPDIGTEWQLSEPVGNLWEFRLPFQVASHQALACAAFMRDFFALHDEAAIGAFYTESTRLRCADLAEEGAKHYCLSFRAWLAPYDFGVSQEVELRTVPSLDEQTFEFSLTLHRVSGDIPSWRRANRVFLNRIRKQFLIWRTVKPEDRQHYYEHGEELLKV